MKSFTYEKNFYNLNILGLSIKGVATCIIEPSTGIIKNYFVSKIGGWEMKFKVCTKQTNLHLIYENMNKMTYGFISLLFQSNEDLKNNNDKYGNIIINIEKNVSNLFQNYFDYSGIFKESLNNLYFEVSNFTRQFLDDLIKLIDQVYINYTIILEKGKNNSYKFIKEIRKVTKDSYINYVYDTVMNLEKFYNKTIMYLDNIEELANQIDIFQKIYYMI